MRTIQGNSKKLFVFFLSLQHNASRNETEFFIELESEKSVVPVAAVNSTGPPSLPPFFGGWGWGPWWWGPPGFVICRCLLCFQSPYDFEQVKTDDPECVCVCMCVRACLSVYLCACVSLASDSSKTIKVIIIKLGTVTASDM